MTHIIVKLGQRSYPICLADSYRELPAQLKRVGLETWGCVISHQSLLDRFGHHLLTPLHRAGFTLETITIPESERSKSWTVVQRVAGQLARRARMRLPVLFAFGGGVVGDLTGFVAAMFRRGVPYVQIPTTLLAQVDSAIGGKTGIDIPEAKNLLGAFYQPRVVWNHLGVLSSLPLRQRRSGLSEIIKYAVMADAPLFAFIHTHRQACLRGVLRVDRVLVERCCRIKARIVSRDERETKGIRAQLNFGHTLGHALEAATGYRRFTHGEAIAVGMACASRMSQLMGIMPEASHARVVSLLEEVGLPTTTRGMSLASIQRALVHDKKFVGNRMRWVLPTRIGHVIVRDDVPPSVMWRAIREHVT